MNFLPYSVNPGMGWISILESEENKYADITSLIQVSTLHSSKGSHPFYFKLVA